MGDEFKQMIFRLPPKVKDKFEAECKLLGEEMSVVARKLVIAFNQGKVSHKVLDKIDSGLKRGRPKQHDDWSDE